MFSWLGHIAVALLVDPLDMLPAHPVGRHGPLRRRRQRVFVAQQRGRHLVGIRRLGQIIDGPCLNRGDRGGNIAVAGQDNDTNVAARLAQLFDHLESAAIAQAQIDDGVFRTVGERQVLALGNAFGHRHNETAALHGLAQLVAEIQFVIDDQQRHVARRRRRVV